MVCSMLIEMRCAVDRSAQLDRERRSETSREYLEFKQHESVRIHMSQRAFVIVN